MTTEDDFQALRAIIEVEQKTKWWGQTVEITPRLVRTVFGDGTKLIGLAPTMYRPHHWIVRVDSSWDLSNRGTPPLLVDHIDEIYDAIENEYIEWPWADLYDFEGTDEDSRRVNFDDGSCWWEEEWPKP